MKASPTEIWNYQRITKSMERRRRTMVKTIGTSSLGRHCKDPLSSSKDWDETNSEMNKEMKNHSGSQRPAAKDANWK